MFCCGKDFNLRHGKRVLLIRKRIPVNVGSDKVDVGTVRETAGKSSDSFCPGSEEMQLNSGISESRLKTHLCRHTVPGGPQTDGPKNQQNVVSREESLIASWP